MRWHALINQVSKSGKSSKSNLESRQQQKVAEAKRGKSDGEMAINCKSIEKPASKKKKSNIHPKTGPKAKK